MRKKDCAYLIAILLAGVALGLVAGLGIAGVAYPIYQSDKWAAWVQAVGSIGAIAGSVYTIREGAKASLRLKNEQEKQAALAVADAFLDQVEGLMKEVSRAKQSDIIIYFDSYGSLPLSQLLRAVEGIPIFGFFTPAAIKALLALQKESKYFVAVVEALEEGAWSPRNPSLTKLEKLRDNWEECSSAYGKFDYETIRASKQLQESIIMYIQGRRSQLHESAKRICEHVSALNRELR